MRIQVEGFDWDHGNRLKCQKHGISVAEIESFFHREILVAPDMKHSDKEERFLAIGVSSKGQPMLVVFTLRGKEETMLIRPISARYMHDKEVKQYAQAFAKNAE